MRAYMLNCGWGDLRNCQPIDAASCWQGWMQTERKHVSKHDGRYVSKHVNKNSDMYAYKGVLASSGA